MIQNYLHGEAKPLCVKGEDLYNFWDAQGRKGKSAAKNRPISLRLFLFAPLRARKESRKLHCDFIYLAALRARYLGMITFNGRYFSIAFALFIIEVLIAVFVHDSFIRPYLGDFLVVILIYCAVRSFIKVCPLKIAIGTLLFSYLIETFQYFGIVDKLGLSKNILARTVIGYGFEWWDILAYTLGIATILAVENLMRARSKKRIELTRHNL